MHKLLVLFNVINYEFVLITKTRMFEKASDNDVTLVAYRDCRKDRKNIVRKAALCAYEKAFQLQCMITLLLTNFGILFGLL